MSLNVFIYKHEFLFGMYHLAIALKRKGSEKLQFSRKSKDQQIWFYIDKLNLANFTFFAYFSERKQKKRWNCF